MNTGKAGRRIRKTDNGFTLIELVAVLAILAVLAGITIPFGLRYVEQARRQKQLLEGRQLSMAVSMLVLEDAEWGDGSGSTLPFESIYWKKLSDADNPLNGFYPSDWDPEGMVTEILTDASGKLHEITYQASDGSRETWTFSEEEGRFQVEVTRREP